MKKRVVCQPSRRVFQFVLIFTFLALAFLILLKRGESNATSGTVPIEGTELYSQIGSTLEQVNAYRAEYGAEPLQLDSKLTEFAMERAYELFIVDNHECPNGYGIMTRISKAGYESAGVGELVAGSGLFSGNTPATVGVNLFKSSTKGHAAALRTSAYSYIGIGIAYMENTGYSWCYLLSDHPFSGSSSVPSSDRQTIKEIEVAGDYASLVVTKVALQVNMSCGDTDTFWVWCSKLSNGELGQRAIVPNSRVTFTSSNPSVLEVNNAGVFRALSPGTATVTVRLPNGISGSYTFTVKSGNINSTAYNVYMDGKATFVSTANHLTLSASNFVYTDAGKDIKPTITVKHVQTGATLVEGRDFKVSYSATRNTGTTNITSTITIEGIGNYSGKRSVAFTIKPAAKTPTATTTPAAGSSSSSTSSNTSSSGSSSNSSSSTSTTTSKPATPAVTKVTKIALTGTTTIKTGGTTKISATVVPGKATNKKLSWSSSNTKVATVDSKGNVKGVGPGKATITASATDGSGVKRSATVTVNINFKAPKVSATNTSKGITVKWSNKTTGATGYYVYRRTAGKKWTRIATVKGSASSYTDKKAKNGTLYAYTVRAYHGKSLSSYNKTGAKIYRLSTTKISSISNKKTRKLYLKWKRNSKVTGYQIQYATNKSFTGAKTKTVKGNKKLTVTLTKMKKNKRYYVRVRSYINKKGVKSYSGWSTVKNVKIKR